MRADLFIALGVGGFVGGVFLHSFIDLGLTFSVFLLLLGCGFLIYRTRLAFSITACVLIGLGLGLLRYDAARLPSPSLPTGERLVLVGTIINEPSEKEGVQRLVVELSDETKLLVSTNTAPAYSYGDKLEIVGQLVRPKNFSTRSDPVTGSDLVTPEFDWVGYLAKDGISYQMFRPQIRVLAHDQGNPLVSHLFRIKHAFTGNVERVIAEPASALLGGLVLGAKSSLGEELTEKFRRTGVSHIVALSGYNMTIVADNIVSFFSLFLSRAVSYGLGVVGILLFSIMAGAGATVVRAAIMALIVILARARGNTYRMGRALVFAGALMILHNPRILVFDLSFQLSFLATLGILYGPPIIEPYFRWLTEKLQLRATAITTSSAQIAVLPLILYKMGNLSIVALPVNMLILPLIPATMLWGFLTGIAGFLGSAPSLPFAFVSYILLIYELTVVKLFSALPFAAVEFFIPLWLMILMYAGMATLVYKMGKGTKITVDNEVDKCVDKLGI